MITNSQWMQISPWLDRIVWIFNLLRWSILTVPTVRYSPSPSQPASATSGRPPSWMDSVYDTGGAWWNTNVVHPKIEPSERDDHRDDEREGKGGSFGKDGPCGRHESICSRCPSNSCAYVCVCGEEGACVCMMVSQADPISAPPPARVFISGIIYQLLVYKGCWSPSAFPDSLTI